MILPTGTLSKKLHKGAFSRESIILLWISVDDFRLELFITTTLPKAKIA